MKQETERKETNRLLIPFEDCAVFSERDRAFAKKNTDLQEFLRYEASLSGLNQALKARKFAQEKREILVRVLRKQYESIENSNSQKQDIDALLHNDCYTVITAHQPSVALGPLYTVYKTLSCLKLSQQLTETTGQKILPIFIIGGEDHDFEEIRSFHAFDQSFTWDNQGQTGSVGRMQTDGLQDLYEELENHIGNRGRAREILDIMSHWKTETVYGVAVQKIMHDLFGHLGLIVLRMDDHELKKSFIPVLQEEILHSPSMALILKEQEKLINKGYGAQAHPREINLFYFHNGERKRLARDGDDFALVDSDIRWSQEEMLSVLHEYPERFSPNVIMRPIYQEYTLPNIAYIGGGGELAYWMERGSQFKHFDVPFPVLIRRDSYLLLQKSDYRRLLKTGLSIPQLFQDKNNVEFTYAMQNREDHYRLDDLQERILDLMSKTGSRLAQLDPTLESSTAAVSKGIQGELERLEKKVLKAIRLQNQETLERISDIRRVLLPHGVFQERYENFIPYYLEEGRAWLETLLAEANPLDTSLKVILRD